MLDNLVLKVASRCNLNCSYCYMYNLGDTTYLNQPKVMSDKIVDSLISRVFEYTEEFQLNSFQFVFHGGEPLLAPKKWYQSFIDKVESKLSHLKLTYSLQTNGVLYDREWAVLLRNLNISVGFSWDGPKHIHDKFRLTHGNKGSYEDVRKGMENHRKYVGKVGGLSVINAEVSPSEYYENIREMGIDAVSMLLPYYHYDMDSEFHKFNFEKGSGMFGKWLVALFDIWWSDSSENKPQMLFYNDFIGMLFGFKLVSESFGNEEGNVLVIETNGDIETSAALKSISNGYTKEGNSIIDCSLKKALNSELVILALNSHKDLPDECLKCPIVNICGGGRINQRYSKKNEFNNPSVYCNDIKILVSHIQNTIYDSIDEKDLEEIGLKKLSYGTF